MLRSTFKNSLIVGLTVWGLGRPISCSLGFIIREIFWSTRLSTACWSVLQRRVENGMGNWAGPHMFTIGHMTRLDDGNKFINDITAWRASLDTSFFKDRGSLSRTTITTFHRMLASTLWMFMHTPLGWVAEEGRNMKFGWLGEPLEVTDIEYFRENIYVFGRQCLFEWPKFLPETNLKFGRAKRAALFYLAENVPTFCSKYFAPLLNREGSVGLCVSFLGPQPGCCAWHPQWSLGPSHDSTRSDTRWYTRLALCIIIGTELVPPILTGFCRLYQKIKNALYLDPLQLLFSTIIPSGFSTSSVHSRSICLVFI